MTVQARTVDAHHAAASGLAVVIAWTYVLVVLAASYVALRAGGLAAALSIIFVPTGLMTLDELSAWRRARRVRKGIDRADVAR